MYSVYRIFFFGLDGGLVWDRSYDLWEVVLDGDGVSLTRLDGLPLQVHMLASSLRSPLLLSVGLNTIDKLLSALGVLDVLGADVHTLLNVSVADQLVEYDSEGGFGDVVDNTSLTVVDLVWHTLLNGTIGLDVDNVPNTELCKIGGHANHTLLLEAPGEGISCSCSETAGVTHCVSCLI